MAGRITVERAGVLATITLSNPTKKNALDGAILDAIADAVLSLPDDGVRAIVLTAEGTIFSAGYDIAELDGRPESAAPLERAVRAIVEGPVPVIAALPGLAIGGGCELACACDLRVAHPGVALQMPPVRRGLVYTPSGLRRFVSLIGASRTRELFLTGERIPADRALGWGLVDRVVPDHEVLPTAMTLATAIAKGSPSAIAGTRHLLARIEPPLPPDLEAVSRAAFASEDAVEARRAFAEKRPPKFTP